MDFIFELAMHFLLSSHPGKGTREARRYLDHESSYQTADGHGLPCESFLTFMQSKRQYYWIIYPLFLLVFALLMHLVFFSAEGSSRRGSKEQQHESGSGHECPVGEENRTG